MLISEATFIYKGGLQSVPKDVSRVSIHQSVRAIPNIAFKSCKQLKHLEFAKGSQLQVIGSFAFMDCIALELVELPKTTKRIGCGAFANCSGLRVVIFQEGLEVIGLSSFKGCHGLVHVSIPGSVNLMEPRAFANCTGLCTVAIKDGLTKIPDLAFDNCDDLEVMGIPPSVTSIGLKAIPKGVKQEREHWYRLSMPPSSGNIRSASMQTAPIVSPTNSQPTQEESPDSTPIKQNESQLELDDDDDDDYISVNDTNTSEKVGAILEDKAVQTKATVTKDSASMTTPITDQITVPLDQWKALNARLDVLEETNRTNNYFPQVQQTENTLRKEMQSQVYTMSRTLENKTVVFQEKQKSFELELESMNAKYQAMSTELQQTKEERDALKKRIVAMSKCLEVLKEGVELLATRDHAANIELALVMHEEPSNSKRPRSATDVLSVSSEEEDQVEEDRPKKRSRTELKQAFSDSLVEIGKIPQKIVSSIHWPW